MAKVKMKATAEEIEEGAKDQGEFVLPKPGYYILTLGEVNPGFSKTNGEEDKKKPRLECIYSITGVGLEDTEPTTNYGNVWDYVSYSKESGFARGRFLRAIGLAKDGQPFDGEFEVDPDARDTIIGTKVLARLKITPAKGDYSAKAKVASLLPYSERNTVDGSSSAFADDATDDGEVFGGGGEEPAGDYTQEELETLEPKELGDVARDEFNLNPEDFLVKVRGKVNVEKSKTKLVDAILEAQAAEDPAADDGGDAGSPF